MKTALKLILLPVLFILVVMELASRFLSRTAQIIVTAIGTILFLVVVLSAVFGIASIPECIRNGIIIIAIVTAVNLTAAIPALLEAARDSFVRKTNVKYVLHIFGL